ncbi:MAG TPA: hypothetical protein VFL28_06400 [bacterium]|nr:hypothetical protein [bacterium]
MLRGQFFKPEQVEAIVRDYRNAGLASADIAMLAFAEKVTLHANEVTEEDVDELRGHGFADVEILDIVLAAARNFFSRVVDALGAEPDPEYLDLETGLRRTLAVARPFWRIGRTSRRESDRRPVNVDEVQGRNNRSVEAERAGGGYGVEPEGHLL